jgi:hypothetical protein
LESISRIRIETVEAPKNSRSPLSYLNIRKACLLILEGDLKYLSFEDPEIQRPK